MTAFWHQTPKISNRPVFHSYLSKPLCQTRPASFSPWPRRSLPRMSFQESSFTGQPYVWTAAVRSKRTRRQQTVCKAPGTSGSMDDFRDMARRLRKTVQKFVKTAVVALWDNGRTRWAIWCTVVVGLVTIALNTWFLRYINHKILPSTTRELTQIMERDVSLGEVKWVLPTGLIGLTPLASVGPVEIGPGLIEKSEITVSEIRMGLDCVRSALRREFVTSLHCNNAELKLVQADNYSWFGRPVDTTPPSADFIPGVHRQSKAGAEESEMEAGTSKGSIVEDSLIRGLAKWRRKIAQFRREKESKISSQRVNTSSEASDENKEKDRHVVASLSADVAPDDKGTENSDKNNSKTRHSPANQEKKEPVVPRRLRMAKTSRETSHGFWMKRSVHLKSAREQSRLKRLAEQQSPKTEEPIAETASTQNEMPGGEADAKSPQITPEEVSPTEVGTKATEKRTNQLQETDDSEQTTPDEVEQAEGSDSDREVSMEEVKSWMTAFWRHSTKDVRRPDIAVGQLSVSNGTILAYTTAEEIPRELVNVKGNAQMGHAYRSLQLDLRFDAHKRNPASIKLTKNAPSAPVHLRFVTPGAETEHDRRFDDDVTAEKMSNGTLASRTSVHGNGTGTAMLEKDHSEGARGATPGPSLASISTVGSNQRSVTAEGLNDVNQSPRKTFPPPSKKPRANVPESQIRTDDHPKGGSVRVTVEGKNLFQGDRVPDIRVDINARHLHAPILERLLEIPIDIQGGRVDGTVKITANTPRMWQLPRIDGQLVGKGVDMHFWDAPDHLYNSNFELILMNNRMYFHNASTHFGAIPLKLSGDMDIDPESGVYRLTGVVPPVEVNVARATLGIRPTPNPVAGSLTGRVHCKGPLREPVFFGSFQCVRPTAEMMIQMEDTNAKDALESMPSSVGAFDKIPVMAGRVLFTHDTGIDVCTIHDFAIQPVGGGKVHGSGQLWVAPSAERDPKAVHFDCEGQNIDAHGLIQRYAPDSVEFPKVLDCGASNFRLLHRGSHAAPETSISWESPSVQLTGEASLSRDSWKAKAVAPSFSISGTLHTQFPEFGSMKQILVQSEMTRFCKPKIKGVDTDISLDGCDILPLLSQTQPQSRVKPDQMVRLKITGNTRIRAEHVPSFDGDSDSHPQRFKGDVSLQGLRLNQVSLAKNMAGQLEVSPAKVSLNARGQRDDEMLDFSVFLPQKARPDCSVKYLATSYLMQGNDWLATVEESRPMEIRDSTGAGKRETRGLAKGADFTLKQGKLEMSSQVDHATRRVQMRVHGLTLDELELASLRGQVQDLSLDLNFKEQQGRGELHMTMPRYSGLAGELLSGGIRWERDVIRLERMILQQTASRYEVQGEYSIPSTIPQKDTGGGDGGSDWFSSEIFAAQAQQRPTGRWRIQVNVPTADVQELLPGLRFLSQATGEGEVDYEMAKKQYFEALSEGGITAPPLSDLVKKVHRKREMESKGEIPEKQESQGTGLPGIQSLEGTWHGTLQAFGGGGGASTLNFNLNGQSWKWGDYEVDEAITVGSYHSSEGAHLEEVSMRTGEARFTMRGDIMGPKQNATFALYDFPAALLSPVYKSVPALQNAVPNVKDHAQGLKRLMEGWERTKKTLGLSDVKEITSMEKLTKGSPVNGLLFVRGTIAGSASEPEGIVSLDLYDGMIGTTEIATAGAQIALGPEQTIEFKLESTPLESKGLLHVEGTLPLPRDNERRHDADIRLQIRDGGMKIIAAMLPDFKWGSGYADIDFRLLGDILDPKLEGKARFARSTLTVPYLRYPLKHAFGSVVVKKGKLVVDNFETKSGNNGHIKAKGSLDVFKSSDDLDDGLDVQVSNLELKVDSTYNGRLDSHLRFRRCLREPIVSGDIEISKGTMVLQFGSFPNAPTTQETLSAKDIDSPTVLRRHDINFSRAAIPTDAPVLSIPKQVQMKGVQLDKLKLKLGSELKFQVPFMVNLLLSGGVEVSGSPQSLKPFGEIFIDGGMVNLFATQLTIDREDTPSTIRFVPEQGFDPDLDITLTSPAEGFKAICKGRSNNWQENVILRFRGDEGGTSEENLSQAAQLFQTKLSEALVAENGQLALLNLAASTMATMSPRLDTWGQIAGARWRLISAPNIPYLLASSEKLDLQDIFTSLLSGTEIELQYGPTTAVVAHKLHGTTFGTHWNLSLNLTDNLKLTAGVVNTPSTNKSVLFQYSSESRTRMK